MPKTSTAQGGAAAPGRGDDQLAGVKRSLAVLEHLADAADGLSFNEILKLLGVNKSIVFKILNTLVATRYVFKDERSGNYCLTFKISNLGMRKMSRSRLFNQSMVVLRELADATGEFVRLAVVEKDTITWVLSALGQKRILQVDPNYSMEIGLHTHAAGKAWLATMEPREAKRLILARGIAPMTPHSLTTMKDILADLEVTARQGHAISYEQHALGVGAIGAAVMVRRLPDDTPTCVGVVTLASPTAHLDRAALEACAPLVAAAAARLAEVWPQVEPGRA